MRPLRITKKKYLSYFSILKLTRPGYGIHLERLRTVIIKASMVLIKKNPLQKALCSESSDNLFVHIFQGQCLKSEVLYHLCQEYYDSSDIDDH